jgi:hypothetical protein
MIREKYDTLIKEGDRHTKRGENDEQSRKM